MEESKEIQSIYKIFRMSVYISIGIEFFMYALDPVALDYMNGILVTFHEKLRTIPIYNNIVLSKLTTLVSYVWQVWELRQRKIWSLMLRKW